ncbi:MAG: DUF559 domain-containing protein [Solirubrobacterales bacterium]|nr:DUF559 domain-containing protein [Solirubrobacterales bacterium]
MSEIRSVAPVRPDVPLQEHRHPDVLRPRASAAELAEARTAAPDLAGPPTARRDFARAARGNARAGAVRAGTRREGAASTGEAEAGADARTRRVEVERAVVELACRQHGVVGRSQLRALGLADDAIDHRLAVGRLHRLHRGAYAVGHPRVPRDGRWLAAVLAAGQGAVLSHRSAAVLWGLADRDGKAVTVTVPAWRRDRPGLCLRSAALPDDEVGVRAGIPVTTVARTLLDLARFEDARTLRRMVHEAEVGALLDDRAVGELLDRHRGRAGTRALANVLADRRLGADRTRNELELAFLELVVDGRLSPPRTNRMVRVGASDIEVDFAWPERSVAVELDGHATHSTRAKFERDRRRDRLLQAHGWRTVRLTWRQLATERATVLADLRRLLEAGSDGAP